MTVQSQRYDPAADLSELLDHPDNPRRGEDATVGRSVEANGFYGAIVVQSGTRRILAGHTRRRVLLAEGRTAGPVIWLDCDDATANRILLGDNRTAEVAHWDDQQLLDLLTEMVVVDEAALLGSGFSEEDLATLSRRVAAINVGEIDYSREWDDAGMPDYDSDDLNSAYRTVIHFQSEDDADRFFDEIDRPRKKSWWWPEPDGHVGLLSDSRVVGGVDG